MNPKIFDQYDIFKTMHPVKIKIMKDLAAKMEGKKVQQAAPYLMEAMNELNRHGLTFTPQESSVLIEILSQDMSPQDKAKVEMMRHAAQKNNRKR